MEAAMWTLTIHIAVRRLQSSRPMTCRVPACATLLSLLFLATAACSSNAASSGSTSGEAGGGGSGGEGSGDGGSGAGGAPNDSCERAAPSPWTWYDGTCTAAAEGKQCAWVFADTATSEGGVS